MPPQTRNQTPNRMPNQMPTRPSPAPKRGCTASATPQNDYSRTSTRYMTSIRPSRTASQRTPRVPRSRLFLIAGMALVLGCALWVAAMLMPQTSSNGDSQNAVFSSLSFDGKTPTATSTPKDEWKKGTMPFLYQIDPEWKDLPYAAGTIADSGCGPTALSMVYTCLTGNRDKDPAAMAKFSTENGFIDQGLTSWLLMSDGAHMLGLESTELPADTAVLTSELESGRPVIAIMGPGIFTDTGHFIVLTGITDTGELIVHDPNSEENSHKTWDINRVLAQCRNLWSYKLA